jgi:hypothetical protein
VLMVTRIDRRSVPPLVVGRDPAPTV